MEPIQKVLFPVDPAGLSARVVPQVIAMARQWNAEVHLLHVVSTLTNYTVFYVPHPSLDTFEPQPQDQAKRHLEDFADEYFADYPHVKRVVARGDPAEEILKYIETEKVDLVIMGTHARKGLDRVLFGNVADEVARNSSVPVMIVNPLTRLYREKWGDRPNRSLQSLNA